MAGLLAPSVIVTMLLAAGYVRFGSGRLVAGATHGVVLAALGIVVLNSYRLIRPGLATDAGHRSATRVMAPHHISDRTGQGWEAMAWTARGRCAAPSSNRLSLAAAGDLRRWLQWGTSITNRLGAESWKMRLQDW